LLLVVQNNETDHINILKVIFFHPSASIWPLRYQLALFLNVEVPFLKVSSDKQKVYIK
jgi:hypothetical protein